MSVYKDNRPTKDGKIWFFKTQYEDIDGLYKTKKSGRYHTKKEPKQAKLEFKIKIHEHENQNEMTCEHLIELFLNFKEIRVRKNTFYGWK